MLQGSAILTHLILVRKIVETGPWPTGLPSSKLQIDGRRTRSTVSSHLLANSCSKVGLMVIVFFVVWELVVLELVREYTIRVL